MKAITYIARIISTIIQTNAIQINKPEILTKFLQKNTCEKTIWFVGNLADSIENQIIGHIKQNFIWTEKLKNWNPPTLADYRKSVLAQGAEITHIEVHREVIYQIDPEDIPDVGLSDEDKAAFVVEFYAEFSRMGNCGVRRQVLIGISNIPKHGDVQKTNGAFSQGQFYK